MRLDLIFTMRNKYINANLGLLANLEAAAEPPGVKIFFHGAFLV